MEKEGGPRLLCALARRIWRVLRRSWIGSARRLSGTANEAVWGMRAAIQLPGKRTKPGYIGHLAFAWKPAPDSSPFIGVEQWCLPSRRQQAGRFAFRSEPKAGPNSEMLKRASNRMAEKRRKRSC
jgi:hypothetical protein